eukprot:scaffold345_cov134-Cylindrotheca_fusiformis.AAC.30
MVEGNDRRRDEFDPTLLLEKRLAKGMVATSNSHQPLLSFTLMTTVSVATSTPPHREGLRMDHYLRSCQRPTDETESPGTTTSSSHEIKSNENNQAEHDYFPVDEVHSLEMRAAQLSQSLPTLNLVPTGILKRIQLVGIFPTTRWLNDVTMPADVKELFGGTPFHALGEYRVAYVGLIDSMQQCKEMTIIVNTGVEGMKTGYWGGTFDRNTYKCVAKFELARDADTTAIHQNTTEVQSFAKFANFEFLHCLGAETTPGICSTPFETLLGIIVEFLLGLDWKDFLHESLIETIDRSSRKERRKRAMKRFTPRNGNVSAFFQEQP